MPLYPLECDAEGCADRTEALLSIREYEAHEWPQCPTCAGPMHRIWLARGEPAQRFDPIVYGESSSGEMWFPGTSASQMPERFARKEVRNFREYEHFRHKVDRRERRQIEAMVEQDHMHAALSEDTYRGDLRMAMQSMSPAHREFARIAIEHSNNSRMRSFDPNTYVEAMEFDSTNREPERDARTNWQARRR